jgi:uncharacterized SAM-binding protein YcdF (DUF218 family)
MKDAIVVLAGGVLNDGTLPDLPRKRVELGAAEYFRNVAPRVILTGKYGFWLDWKKNVPPRTEASAMKDYILSLGVPAEAVLLEEESKDTIGNFYFVRKNILDPNGWKNIVVVTSDFHADRTKFIVEMVSGSEFAVEYVFADSGLSSDELEARRRQEVKTIEVLKETFARGVTPGDMQAVESFLFTQHPGYSQNPKYSYEDLWSMLGRN